MLARPAAMLARATGWMALAVVASCVTTYESAEFGDEATLSLAVPVTIPISSVAPGHSPQLIEFYGGIMRRLQDAAADGDVPLIDALLVSYDKPELPAPIRETLAGYHALARGIEFQRHVVARARLVLVDPDAAAKERPANDPRVAVRGSGPAPAAGEPETPRLGSPLIFELRVPASSAAVRLGGLGDDEPTGFSVALTIEDEFVDGSTSLTKTDRMRWLPEAVSLSGDAVLTLPIEIDAAAGDAVRRTVYVRVDLMPGYVDCDGVRAPTHRLAVAAGSWTQWPRGYEVLAKTPLAALRLALGQFTPNNFASAYLAAMLVPEVQRREAEALLIDQVRFGRADQAQVAMAALRRIANTNLPIGDRDAWLAWWQARH